MELAKQEVQLRKEQYDFFTDSRLLLKTFTLGKVPDELEFINTWLNEWCKQYPTYLMHPNKHFSVLQLD